MVFLVSILSNLSFPILTNKIKLISLHSQTTLTVYVSVRQSLSTTLTIDTFIMTPDIVTHDNKAQITKNWLFFIFFAMKIKPLA